MAVGDKKGKPRTKKGEKGKGEKKEKRKKRWDKRNN